MDALGQNARPRYDQAGCLRRRPPIERGGGVLGSAVRGLSVRGARQSPPVLCATPDQFWRRQWDALGARPAPLPLAWFGAGARMPMGLQGRFFTGDLDRAGHNGLLVDDSKDGDTVTGWPGGAASATGNLSTRAGEGPGRGVGGTGISGGAGGSAATVGDATGGSSIGVPGLIVPPEYTLQAVHSNDYTRDKYLASGSGAAGSSGGAGNGGDSGAGLLRQSLSNLIESTSRALAGADGSDRTSGSGAGGAGGAGGVYLATCGGNYTLQVAAVISALGGARGGGADGRNGGMAVAGT